MDYKKVPEKSLLFYRLLNKLICYMIVCTYYSGQGYYNMTNYEKGYGLPRALHQR